MQETMAQCISSVTQDVYFVVKVLGTGSAQQTNQQFVNSKPRLLNLILLNLIVRWPTSAAIILIICGMRSSVFERLKL